MDFLEYSDINAEIKGAMTPGKLKMTDQHIVWKNNRTGKVEQISASDISVANYQKFVNTWGLRIFLKNGVLHRYSGFKESEQEKIAKFFKANYEMDMLEKELSLKGWNWGTAKFDGSVLSFNVGHNTAFEIPLNHVSQCTTGKNEITLEFHQNDDAPVGLLEMRFHIPSSELAGDLDPVDSFQKQVMDKASVISVSGDAIAIFREIQCLTPRGRYDIKIFSTFFQLHGKTFDYKIPMSTVLRLFLLPHKDQRQKFFVVSLDPPIKQGQTRYHYLVLLFSPEETTSLELPFTEEELKEKYEDKLTKELAGPTCDVLGKIMKAIINRKLTTPAGFVGHSGTPAIGCSYKAAAGYLYPLERGFIYVHKPPVHIRFEEISSVNFARSGGSTRSFDFEIELKSGAIYTFNSIEKEEYGKLFDFITSKKLNVKNRGKNEKSIYKDDFGDSDQEQEPDAYLERVKAEAKERDEDDEEDEDESTDEDFKPNQEESDVAEEYDSAHDSDSDEDSDSEKKKRKRESKPKQKKSSEKRSKKSKKNEDPNRPKRPTTAFMLWMNENRDEIKKDHPNLKITEIAKKAGEIWKDLPNKVDWENKAKKAKEDYDKAIKEYEASGAGKNYSNDKSKSKSTPKKSSPASKSSTGNYKSKEYISDDDSSSSAAANESSDDSTKPAKKKAKKETSTSDSKEKSTTKKKKSDDENEESEEEEEEAKSSSAASSEASDDD